MATRVQGQVAPNDYHDHEPDRTSALWLLVSPWNAAAFASARSAEVQERFRRSAVDVRKKRGPVQAHEQLNRDDVFTVLEPDR